MKPTPEQAAKIKAIHARIVLEDDNGDIGWTDIAVLTAIEYAAEVERERDEARLKLNGTIEFVLNENAQLRKVADEWKRIWEKMNDVRSDCVNRDGSFSFANGSKLHRELSAVCAMTNQLPHVVERNK